jgi:hypothetical protein
VLELEPFDELEPALLDFEQALERRHVLANGFLFCGGEPRAFGGFASRDPSSSSSCHGVKGAPRLMLLSNVPRPNRGATLPTSIALRADPDAHCFEMKVARMPFVDESKELCSAGAISFVRKSPPVVMHHTENARHDAR